MSKISKPNTKIYVNTIMRYDYTRYNTIDLSLKIRYSYRDIRNMHVVSKFYHKISI